MKWMSRLLGRFRLGSALSPGSAHSGVFVRRSAALRVVVSVALVVTAVTGAAQAAPHGAATTPPATSWHRVPAPIPTARTRPGPYAAVSCPTRSFCMAIATGFGPRGYRVGIAEIERHGRWTVSETPPIGSPQSSLTDVSCASATWCVVVGSADVATSPVILRWNGSDWRMLTGSATAGDGPVTAVSCASAGYCLALGAQHAWTIRGDQLTPVAPGEVDTAVSCVSATYCLATGSLERAGRRLNLVERWDGSTWSDVAAGDVHPGGQRVVTLTGVSCAAVAECSVIGDVIHVSTSGRLYRFFTETDDGGRWHRQALPAAAGVDVHRTAFGVSCSSPDHCVAAVRGRVGGRPATEILAGGRGGWTLMPLRYPHGGIVAARLTASSCGSGGCTLVGGGRGVDPSGHIVHERGATARNETPAAVRQADDSALLSVSCTGSLCLAVGHANAPGSTLSPFAAATTGGPWHQVATPPWLGGLYDVSCVTAQFCMALGHGPRRTVSTAGIWNGTSWRAATVTGPPVRGLTCPTTRFCAGSPVRTGNQLLWSVWRPAAGWQTETLSPPAGLHATGPISCASATDCWAITSYYGLDEDNHVIASHWDGSTWTSRRLRTGRSILHILCPSTDFCVAVGWTKSQVWDGTSWTAVPYANVASLDNPRVSCVDAEDCTLVAGTPIDTPVNTITQHWNGQEWGGQDTYPGAVSDISSLGCDPSGCVTVGRTNPRADVPTILQSY